MTELVPFEGKHYDNLNEVVKLHVQTYSPTEIAKKTGLKRTLVLDLLKEFKESARSSEDAKERVNEAIRVMDEHFNQLVREAWKTLRQVDEKIAADGISAQLLQQRTVSINAIKGIESDRIETMHKAGMIDAADAGTEIARMEEERAQVLDILRNDLCDKCRPSVLSKLASMTGHVSPVVVYDE